MSGGRRRASWCTCRRNRLCPQHSEEAAAVERAFARAQTETPTLPVSEPRVEPQPPAPGAGVDGFNYDTGDYWPGFQPERDEKEIAA